MNTGEMPCYEVWEPSEEQMAREENALRNMEAALLAKTDYPSLEVRAIALADFYELAAQLRAMHQEIRRIRLARMN